MKKIKQQQAWAAIEDLESVSDSSNDETAYQAKTDPCWIIDLDATSYCTDDILIFKYLNTQAGKLIIVDGVLRIMERGDVIIRLLNSFTAKLAGVLMVSNIGMNLLSIQALLA